MLAYSWFVEAAVFGRELTNLLLRSSLDVSLKVFFIINSSFLLIHCNVIKGTIIVLYRTVFIQHCLEQTQGQLSCKFVL